MTEEHKATLNMPTYGTTMDPSGLFGLEGTTEGMLRAIGPNAIRSRWRVIPEVAETLIMSWQPASGLIDHLLTHDAEDEALHEALQFVRAWDMMAAGQTTAWIVSLVMVLADEVTHFALDGIAHVQPGEDGLMYLARPDGTTSRLGMHPKACALMVLHWNGLNGAADIAVEHFADPYDRLALGKALMAHWDREGQGYHQQVRGQLVAA